MMEFTIVGKRFSPGAFDAYAAHLPLDVWRPTLVVLHNTAVPNLRDRPNGLTEANVADLRHYYAAVQGWSGGPHLFVDALGIWAFNPLDRRGVHSPSWNAISWGVEMLGDYSTESFDSGKGLEVRRNAISALAALYRRLGIDLLTDANFKLHKEDPKTSHDCPGRNVEKRTTMAEVQSRLDRPLALPTPSATKIAVYPRGGGGSPAAVLDAVLREGTVYADAQTLAKSTGIATEAKGEVALRPFVQSRYDVRWVPETHRVYLAERSAGLSPNG